MAFARSSESSAARGYGTDHRRARRAWLAALEEAGVGVCCIGGEPIYPAQAALPRDHPRALVLDHTPDRTGYRGLACALHNRSDGARRGRQRQTVTARAM